MIHRITSACVLSAAVIGLILAPSSQAAPGADPQPPCLAEHTCALLIKKDQPRYLPLTPASSTPQDAPPAPAAR